MTWDRFVQLSDRGMEAILLAVVVAVSWPIALIGYLAERLAAQGTSGSAQDAKRLDPKGAGPVGRQADAPKGQADV